MTDRCNFRCLYCMPAEGLQWLPKAEILSYEEIAGVVSQLAPLGLRRLRITGGEPTIRPNLEELIRMLRAVPEIEDIALSTNGVRAYLRSRAVLRDAGTRSHQHERRQSARGSHREDRAAQPRVRSGASALAAERAGLAPIKINVVVMRGINDDEIEDFARLTLDHPWHVRFIELMPVGDMRGLTWEHVVPSDDVLSRIASLGRARQPRWTATRQRARDVLSTRRRARHGRRHHADDAHLLRDRAIACDLRRTEGFAPVSSAITKCDCATRSGSACRSSHSSDRRLPTSRRSTSCCR